jgi:hypothetical protein
VKEIRVRKFRPPDGKSAIRNTFFAAEGLFKLMFPKSPRLTAQEAQKLETPLKSVYASNPVALSAATKLLNGFKDWIDAAHFYRHEAGHEEPTQPPLTLSLQMISQGAAFIRWLAELVNCRSEGVLPAPQDMKK